MVIRNNCYNNYDSIAIPHFILGGIKMSIYLDASATTKPKQEVIKAMMPYLIDQWYNPSALYSKSSKIKEDIERARNTIGDFINADGKEIYFTSGGSEGNCWAIQGFINRCNRKGKEATIITSTIEHKSIMSCVENMNADIHYVGVDKQGFVDIIALESLIHDAYLEANEILVSIQFANNEIGTIQNIKMIAELAHKYNAIFHTDAVQAFGHIQIDVEDLGIDLLSASGHKVGCPKGCGFLYIKNGVQIDPLIYGSQMDSMRGGTENVPFIIGMAKAIDLINNDQMCNFKTTILRNNFISELKAIGCTLNGSFENRLPNNINVTFNQNVTGESLIYMLDMSDIMVSSGSACNSHSTDVSYVLKAIGLSDAEAMRTLRITLPDNITGDDLDNVICEIKKQITLLTI